MLLSAEDIFWREMFFGGKLSSCATQYHTIFLSKTIQLVQSRREDRLKKSARPTINKATSAKHTSTHAMLMLYKNASCLFKDLADILLIKFLN